MKNDKGITLLSLVIYIMIMMLVLGMLSALTTNIYSNLGDVDTGSYSSEEFNKFNLNFIKDVKNSESANVNNSGQNVQIILSNNTNYNYVANEHSIYRDKVKIAENIKQFNAETLVKNGKNVVKVTVGTGKNSIDYGKTINYVLKYW